MSTSGGPTPPRDPLVASLQASLKSEQDKVAALQSEVQLLKVRQVESLASAEAQEEYVTNMLLKKLEAITTERDELVQRVTTIQKEREALIVQLEQEEEYLTNTLQKKLTTVLREKIELENQLEQEEEYIVNELQKKLSKLQAEKAALEARLQEEKESHEVLRRTQAQLDKAVKQNQDLQRELAGVRSENFGLTQKINKEHQLLQHVAQAKAKLEQGLEMDEERAFNDELASGRRAGRHRTRSYSLPVHDQETSPSGSSDRHSSPNTIIKSSSGSSGLNMPSNSSSSQVSSLSSPSTSLSPPTSPRSSGSGSSGDTKHATAPLPGSSSSSGRVRRLSLAAASVVPSFGHHFPSTPRAPGQTLKQGWMRCLPRSKLPQADPDLDPEPATDLYFVLADDSTLVAWMNELHGDDGTPSIFSINLDTVVRRSSDPDSGELLLETKETVYNLRPHGEDSKDWHDLLEQLDPLASGASTPSH